MLYSTPNLYTFFRIASVSSNSFLTDFSCIWSFFTVSSFSWFSFATCSSWAFCAFFVLAELIINLIKLTINITSATATPATNPHLIPNITASQNPPVNIQKKVIANTTFNRNGVSFSTSIWYPNNIITIIAATQHPI